MEAYLSGSDLFRAKQRRMTTASYNGNGFVGLKFVFEGMKNIDHASGTLVACCSGLHANCFRWQQGPILQNLLDSFFIVL